MFEKNEIVSKILAGNINFLEYLAIETNRSWFFEYLNSQLSNQLQNIDSSEIIAKLSDPSLYSVVFNFKAPPSSSVAISNAIDAYVNKYPVLFFYILVEITNKQANPDGKKI